MVARVKVLVAAVALVAAVFGGSNKASADFRLCSEFKQTIWAAYAYWDGSGWTSEGWWDIRPWACTTVFSGSLQNRGELYVYAETTDGATQWSGNENFCIHEPNGFTIFGRQDCYTGFFRIDTNYVSDYEHYLVP